MSELSTHRKGELTSTSPDTTSIYSYHWRSEHRYIFAPIFLIAPILISPLAAFVGDKLIVEAQVVLAAITPLVVGGCIGWVMQWRSKVSTFALILNRILGSILLSTMTWGYCLVGAVAILMDIERLTWQDRLLAYAAFSLGLSFVISPLVLVWLAVITNRPYEPGAITREAKGDTGRLMLLAGDVQRTKKERVELIGELARHDFDAMAFVLRSDVFNADAIALVARRILQDFDGAQAQHMLDGTVGRMPEPTLEAFMNTWQHHEDRMRIFLALARQKRLQTHDKWAYVLLCAAHEADRSGAQMAAITTLGSARLSQHEVAIAYITKFGMPAHIPHLQEAKRKFSLHRSLGKKIDDIIAHIERSHNVVRGGLSLAADESSKGGITQSEG